MRAGLCRHHRFAALGYLILMVAAILWGVAGSRRPRLKHLSSLGLGVCTWSAVCLVMIYAYPDYAGLFQRGASGLLSLWVLVLAVSIWRTEHAGLGV
jgi:hypothetical protein